MGHEATARAHPNIALVKYWGKRGEAALNLPAAGSVSLTLEGMVTETTVRFDEAPGGTDRVELDGIRLEGAKRERISRFLDLVRDRAGVGRVGAEVRTANDFPTGAGLASSASGFAALALAASRAAGLELAPGVLSALARRGSGSAARSVFGGFVEMLPGQPPDEDASAHAVPLAGADHWNLHCMVAVTARGAKEVGSTEGMERTRRTSPYYEPWVASVPEAVEAARQAIAARDLEALAQVAEASCLRMHASALAADPGVIYWRGATVELFGLVRRLRDQGLPCFFSVDAGPHVKVFCQAEATEQIGLALRGAPGVLEVLHTRPGPGASLVEP